jgi:hypothetical protein
MVAKSMIAAVFASALVVSVSICGVARAEQCLTELNGDADWCPSSGLVHNLTSDWVIGLVPVGFSPAPTPVSAGSTLLGQVISGVVYRGALLVPPGGSAQIDGPTDVYYDGWGTIALQAGTALCNATKLCSSALKSFPNFHDCIYGVAGALDIATTGVWPDASQIIEAVQTSRACRSAVEDMKARQVAEENKRVPEENKRVPDERKSFAVEALMEEIPKEADLKPIPRAKFNIFEFGKVLLKGRG